MIGTVLFSLQYNIGRFKVSIAFIVQMFSVLRLTYKVTIVYVKICFALKTSNELIHYFANISLKVIRFNINH